MDQSQYIRLKMEAANVYVSRMKTVDSSFLSLQNQQKAASAGNIASRIVDISSCPQDHRYVQGFSATNKLTQQDSRASEIAGGVLCCQVDYSTASPGIQLKNCTEVSTILTQYNSLAPVPGQCTPHGGGINRFFPNPDSSSETCCSPNKLPYPSG